MTPKIYRRRVIQGAGAAAVALTLWDGIQPALPAPAAAAAGPSSNHGLPPSVRLAAVSCSKCGEPIGQMLRDELDQPGDIVCGNCYQDQVDQVEAAQDQLDSAHSETDYDELAGDYDELRESLETRRAEVKRLAGLVERGASQLGDLRSHVALSERERERLADLQSDLLDGLAKVTSVA